MDPVADKARASMSEVLTHLTLDEIFELCLLIESLTRTVVGENKRNAGLVEVELLQVCLVTTAITSGSEDTVGGATRDVLDGFRLETSSGALTSSAGGSSGQRWELVVVHVVFLLHLSECCQFNSLLCFFPHLNGYSISSVVSLCCMVSLQ